MKATIVLLLAILCVAKSQKDPHFDNGKGAIVHLFEWKFSDIADECERFLGPYGYGGVQTSPVNEYLVVDSQNRPWWERYQPMSYKIISRSGDEAAFRDMTSRCNAAGVRIYVDAVLNHMTANWDTAVGTGGSTADTYNKNYPGVPFDSSDFHQTCDVNDFSDSNNVWTCELGYLHDLDQSRDNVRQQQINFLNTLVADGASGFRFDAAKHIAPDDLRYIFSQVNDISVGGRPFFFQEVVDYNVEEAVKEAMYTDFGRVTEFKFGDRIGSAFQGGYLLKDLRNLHRNGSDWQFGSGNDVVVFIDNHDTQRNGGPNILSHKNPRPYKMAVAWMLAWTYGIPRVMSSYYFTDYNQSPPQDDNHNIISPSINDDMTCGNGWVCEHRWREIFAMVGFRNNVEGTGVENWWDNGGNQIAFARGSSGFVVFNGDSSDLQQTLQTGLEAGTYCDVISGDKVNGECTGKVVTVNSDGTADFLIRTTDMDGVMAIHTGSQSKL